MFGIYKIENLINGKLYIGQSKNIESRWKQHLSELNNHTHHNYKLQRDWIEYGNEAFKFSILEGYESLDDKEKYFIEKYSSIENGYNLAEVGYIPEEFKTESFTKSNNDIRLKIIKECGYKEYAMYLTILSHRNYQDGKCYPSISCLSDEMNCTTRTIYNLIGKLEDAGFIEIESGHTGYCNQYKFPYEKFYKNN